MKFETVDPRIVAVVNEYIEKGMEFELAMMLYVVLDALNQEERMKASRSHAAMKRKMGEPARKAAKDKIEAFFKNMTTDELIEFQNTPYEELPDWLKEAMKKLVKYPMENNYVRIYGLVPEAERQQEITASRITRYMEKHGFITSDEKGNHLHFDRFSEVCNELAQTYDIPWRYGKKAQRTRITPRDLKNYTQYRVTPKGDKMAVLAAATDLPVWYLGGYLNPSEPEIKPGNVLSPAPITGQFKKARKRKEA